MAQNLKFSLVYVFSFSYAIKDLKKIEDFLSTDFVNKLLPHYIQSKKDLDKFIKNKPYHLKYIIPKIYKTKSDN